MIHGIIVDFYLFFERGNLCILLINYFEPQTCIMTWECSNIASAHVERVVEDLRRNTDTADAGEGGWGVSNKIQTLLTLGGGGWGN